MKTSNIYKLHQLKVSKTETSPFNSSYLYFFAAGAPLASTVAFLLRTEAGTCNFSVVTPIGANPLANPRGPVGLLSVDLGNGKDLIGISEKTEEAEPLGATTAFSFPFAEAFFKARSLLRDSNISS